MRALGTILIGVAAAVIPSSVRAQEKPALAPSVTVVGSGTVSAVPDLAHMQVGVVTEAPTAAKALKDNNGAMEKLFATLDTRGIARKDVQTSSFSVTPVYKRGPRGEQSTEVVGYRVSNLLRVKVRKLDTLGAVLDEVVQQGANQVHGIGFAVAEPEVLLDAARRKAMADARRKADLYAAAAGVGVARVLLIQEATPHVPSPVMLGVARAAAVPVAEGEQDFRASITVTYALGAGAAAP